MAFRNTIVLPVLLLVLFFSAGASLHNESVGEIVFEQYDATLYARATLEKQYLVEALKKNATCPASTMMSECAPQYLARHMGVRVNGQQAEMQVMQHELTQHNLIVTYKIIARPQAITSLGINSTYMLGLGGHATLNVACDLNEQPKHFTLSARRTSITVQFDQ